MKAPYSLLIFTFFALLVGCNSSPYTYRGNKLKKTVAYPLSQEICVFDFNGCNGRLIRNDSLLLNNSDTISIIGWASDAQGNELGELLIHTDSTYISANYGYYRDDVQKALNSPTNKYGFEFSFAKCLLSDHFELIGISKDGKQLIPKTIYVSYNLE